MGATSSTLKPHKTARTGLRTWAKRILLGLLVLITALPLAGLAYQWVATASDRRFYLPPGERIDIGGYFLHLIRAGDGQPGPTVVLLNCGGCLSANWAWVQPEVARFAPVIAYDRAGFGWSDPGPEPRDAGQNVEELHTLLHRGATSGPYVLVGHSYGGPLASLYAARYPDEVAGLVLLDPRHPDQDARFPPEALEAAQSDAGLVAMLETFSRFGLLRLMGLSKEQTADLPPEASQQSAIFYNTPQYWKSLQAQGAAIQASDEQVRATGSLGDLPLIVISADTAWLTPGAPPDPSREAYTQLNIEQAGLSSNSLHQVVAGSTHTSLVNRQDHAQAVITAIHRVVEAARSGQPLGEE